MKRTRWPLGLLVALLLCAGARASPPNLLTNGDLGAQTLTGWSPFWSRQTGAGSMALDAQTRHGGSPSLRVTQTGTGDWSAEQAAHLPAAPGGLYHFSGWVRCEKAESAEISVVTRDMKGNTLDWTYSPAATGGTHDWERLSRRFVVPAGCASIQFRLTGAGPGTVWLADAALVKEGAVRPALAGKALRLVSPILDVRLAGDGTLAVTDRRTGLTWKQGPPAPGLIVRAAHQTSPRSARLTVWDAANDLTLRATVTLAPAAPELTVTLAGDGPVQEPVAFPAPLRHGKWDGPGRPAQRGHLVACGRCHRRAHLTRFLFRPRPVHALGGRDGLQNGRGRHGDLEDARRRPCRDHAAP